MSIRTKTVYLTDDNKQHDTKEMAQHWDLLMSMKLEMRGSVAFAKGRTPEPDDIINWIDDHRNLVRAYIDATNAMMKEALR